MFFFPSFQFSVKETSKYSETFIFFFNFDLKVDNNSRHFNRYQEEVWFFLNVDFKICLEINVI